MRLINHKDFEPGPFNLGKFGPITGIIACLWITFITVSLKASCSAFAICSLVKGAHLCPLVGIAALICIM